MAKKFSKLRAQMSSKAQAKSEKIAGAMLKQMPLHELRRARGFHNKLWRKRCMYSSLQWLRWSGGQICIYLL